MNNFNIERYIEAHKREYKQALEEIKSGKKKTHWMWYIFPQINGLGTSSTSKYYAIRNIEEAQAYLNNEYLYNHLIEICKELMKLNTSNIIEVLPYPDNYKLCSSMTLFYLTNPKEEIFKQVLDKYYNGKLDEKTIEILNKQQNK